MSRKFVVLIAKEQAEALSALLSALPERPEVSTYSDPVSLLDLPRERKIDLLFLDADLFQASEIPWVRKALESKVGRIPVLLAFSGRGSQQARALQDLGVHPLWKPYLLDEVYSAANQALLDSRRTTGTAPSSSAIPQLVHGLADELNNPLATISGYLQLLSLDLGKNPSAETAEKMAVIRESLARIGGTVEQLALASGLRRAKPSPADLVPLLRETAKAWKSRGKNFPQLRWQESPARLSAALDEKMIGEATEQMGIFFASFLTPKAEIRLHSSTLESGEIVLTWNAASNPIPPDDLPGLFEPYSLRRQGLPAGLALAAVRGILRAHGGDAIAAAGENGSLEIRWILPASSEPTDRS